MLNQTASDDLKLGPRCRYTFWILVVFQCIIRLLVSRLVNVMFVIYFYIS